MTVFRATAKNGKLDFGSEANVARLKEHIKNNDGAHYKLTKVETKRTLTQNAFYWCYLQLIEKETGNDANDLHQYFKRTKLPPKFITVMGKQIKIPKSTTELDKLEFGEYLDKICAESGVALPNPEEAGYISS